MLLCSSLIARSLVGNVERPARHPSSSLEHFDVSSTHASAAEQLYARGRALCARVRACASAHDGLVIDRAAARLECIEKRKKDDDNDDSDDGSSGGGDGQCTAHGHDVPAGAKHVRAHE